MSRRLPAYPPPPDDKAAVYEALADAMASAATYATTATQFADLRDPRGLAYAIRRTSAALLSASELLAEIRPLAQAEGRAA